MGGDELSEDGVKPGETRADERQEPAGRALEAELRYPGNCLPSENPSGSDLKTTVSYMLSFHASPCSH